MDNKPIDSKGAIVPASLLHQANELGIDLELLRTEFEAIIANALNLARRKHSSWNYESRTLTIAWNWFIEGAFYQKGKENV